MDDVPNMPESLMDGAVKCVNAVSIEAKAVSNRLCCSVTKFHSNSSEKWDRASTNPCLCRKYLQLVRFNTPILSDGNINDGNISFFQWKHMTLTSTWQSSFKDPAAQERKETWSSLQLHQTTVQHGFSRWMELWQWTWSTRVHKGLFIHSHKDSPSGRLLCACQHQKGSWGYK